MLCLAYKLLPQSWLYFPPCLVISLLYLCNTLLYSLPGCIILSPRVCISLPDFGLIIVSENTSLLSCVCLSGCVLNMSLEDSYAINKSHCTYICKAFLACMPCSSACISEAYFLSVSPSLAVLLSLHHAAHRVSSHGMTERYSVPLLKSSLTTVLR